MPKKYFYKITRKDQSSSFAKEDLQVRYKTGGFVKAPKGMRDIGYHLLVFHSHGEAIDFRGTMEANALDIWRCECKGVYSTIPPRLRLSYNGVLRYPDIPIKWPKGTIMVESVKLLKKAPMNRTYETKRKPDVYVEENKKVKEMLTT